MRIPFTRQTTGLSQPRIAETMSHEYNALRNVQDQAQQRGVDVPTTRHEALRLIPGAQNFPIGGRHEVMDSYVQDPQGFERFAADGADDGEDL